MKCEFCGMEYQEPPGKFCDRCGRVLSRLNVEAVEEDETEYKRCLKCGHRNRMDATICLNCGDILHEPQI